jgi:hypothetical protein
VLVRPDGDMTMKALVTFLAMLVIGCGCVQERPMAFGKAKDKTPFEKNMKVAYCDSKVIAKTVVLAGLDCVDLVTKDKNHPTTFKDVAVYTSKKINAVPGVSEIVTSTENLVVDNTIKMAEHSDEIAKKMGDDASYGVVCVIAKIIGGKPPEKKE